MYTTMKNGKTIVWRLINCAPLLALGFLAACTPQQVQTAAAVNCVLAADGATVVAVARPGYALPANGLAKIGCDAGTQIGQIVGAAK